MSPVILLHHHLEPGILVVTIHGAPDAADVAPVRAAVTRLLVGEPTRDLVVDLAPTSSAHLATVHTLMQLLLAARRHRRRFRLRHTPAGLRRVLDFAGLTEALDADERCTCPTCPTCATSSAPPGTCDRRPRRI